MANADDDDDDDYDGDDDERQQRVEATALAGDKKPGSLIMSTC